MFECNKLYTPSPITRFRVRSTFSGLWTRLLLACLPWACTQWFHYISGSSNRFIDDWDQCKSVMYCCTVCSAYKVCQSNPPKCQLNKRQTVVGCLVFSVSTRICSCVFFAHFHSDRLTEYLSVWSAACEYILHSCIHRLFMWVVWFVNCNILCTSEVCSVVNLCC